MHNGQIANFDRIRRALEATLPDDLYHARRGTTDSELLFLMTLSNGIEENPRMALQRTMVQIQSVQGPILQPNRVTCVLSDGVDIYAVRHSCDQRSPTLYVSETLHSGGQALASEPLDGIRENWRCIDDNQFVTLSRSGIKIDPFDVYASRTGNSPTGIRTIEPEICDSSAPGQCLNLA